VLPNLLPEPRNAVQAFDIIDNSSLCNIAPNAMVVPWLVIIAGLRAKDAEDAVEVMQILAPHMFLDQLEPGLYACFA
jgi:hypothetical protein